MTFIHRRWPFHGLLVAGLSMLMAACGHKTEVVAAAPSPVDKLQIVELKPGAGPAIVPGQRAVMQYTGWLYEVSAPDNKGKEFDSSRNAGHPFEFQLGTGMVIKGWDQGVAGMQVGQLRRLTIPPDLGYGDSGAGDVIPPGATLIFDVELVGIK